MHNFGLRHFAPKIATHARMLAVLMVLVTLICLALMFTRTTFTGDINENLRNNSETYHQFEALEETFHPFSEDEYLLIESEDLSRPDTYAALQDFLLDLQFAPQMETAFSIFSLPELSALAPGEKRDIGAVRFFLTSPTLADLPVAERLTKLRKDVAFADKMLSEDLTTTLVVLMLSEPATASQSGFRQESVDEILQMASSYKEHFKVSLVGIPEIQRSIRDTLNEDQTKLTIVATIFCILVSGLVFRSWRSAVVCTLPAVVSAVWYFGFLALMKIPVDFLTTIVPTMVIVVAFADGMHLYMAMHRKLLTGASVREAVIFGVGTTGPACFLTSLTTSLAFIGIGIGSTGSMDRLAFTGTMGIMLAFFAVIIILPTTALFLLKRDERSIAPMLPLLESLSPLAIFVTKRFYRLAVVVALLLGAGLVAIHFNTKADFRVVDYLPEDKLILQHERQIEQKLGGTGQLYATIRDPDGQRGISESDKEQISAIFASLNKGLSKPLKSEMLLGMTDYLGEASFEDGNPLSRRFISEDGLSFCIPLPLASIITATEIRQVIEKIEDQLAGDGLKDMVTFSGVSVLTAYQAPVMIHELRAGLISAIFIVIASIMLITRSARLGLACLVPNMIPILAVESYFWFANQPLSLSSVIALTIAFGIAVDNSIHLLNQVHLVGSEDESLETQDVLSGAIKAISPAVMATSLLLIAGLTTSQLSALPSVALFGRLVMASLFFALISNLFLLPSFLAVLTGTKKRRKSLVEAESREPMR
ncbi:MMPL family transporter [uncultured Cohaesibacter sp.]|uniref:efflux RND transporter permease subunit n=1 Tax=uncultured Cohaesibacter sp. TaxID=1002546 RepID=UPI00292FA775|nr:MMPL family transporter [uncultured Cohaesibacter sp.]